MSAYYYIKQYKDVIVVQTDEIAIPAEDEEFIRSIPANVWQGAQKGDHASLAVVWQMAIDAGYDPEYVDREYSDDLSDSEPFYEYDEWSN